jgi:uncharacterized membrane protein
MFHVHSAVAWLDPALKSDAYFRYSMKLSGMVAPCFMFLAGISIGLIAQKAENAAADNGALKRMITLRGLRIWLMGYGLHTLFYIFSGNLDNWTRILKVDILHCIGSTMVIAPWIAWPRKRLNITAFILFSAAPTLSMIAYRLPIQDWLPLGIAAYVTIPNRLSLFPTIPYMSWIMLGLFIAPLYTSALKEKKTEQRFWLGIAVSAIAMWMIGQGIKSGYYALSIHRLGAQPPQVKGVLHFFWFKGAIVLAVFTVVRLTSGILDRVQCPFFVRFGRRSLFAYCIHLMIVYPLLGPYLKRSLSVEQHILASLSLTTLMFFAVIAFEKFDDYSIGRSKSSPG